MISTVNRTWLLFFLLCCALLSSCARPHRPEPADNILAYQVAGDTALHKMAPIFLIEQPQYSYNRIGEPVAIKTDTGQYNISINTERPTIYAERRSWRGAHGSYTNLIYRIHFPEIPCSLIPFHLSAGKNIGLFVIITLDKDNQPLLITTVQACGCYLAFLPTSLLDTSLWPDDWHAEYQYVYGERLPGKICILHSAYQEKLFILLRHGTHRVKDVWTHESGVVWQEIIPATLQPLEALQALKAGEQETVSFFETQGPRTDYVVGSQKIWERLLISWWALDWRVGEDKRLGRDTEDGVVLYTSLKPWARKKSDLRNFAAFLNYWGWKL